MFTRLKFPRKTSIQLGHKCLQLNRENSRTSGDFSNEKQRRRVSINEWITPIRSELFHVMKWAKGDGLIPGPSPAQQ
jgi:hypothetical protein